MATYIHADGTEITLSPPKYFIHKEELQNLVEGSIDIVDMGEKGVLVINGDYYPEGVARNDTATELARSYIPDGTYIAGPAIHTSMREISNPITLAKLERLHKQRSMV